MTAARMLFMGSSSLFFHEFPQQLVELLRREPRWRELRWHWIGEPGTVIHSYLEPGYRVRHGLREGEHVLDHLRTGGYELACLMLAVDRLGNPELGPAVSAAIRAYSEAAAEAGTRLIFYEQGWCQEGLHGERFDWSQTGQRLLAEFIAKYPHVSLAPCRTAWQQVWRERPELELHDLPDRVHPGLLGLFLNLATHLAAITDREPELPDELRHDPITWIEGDRSGRIGMAAPVAIDPALAAFLRGCAWSAWTTIGRPVSGREALRGPPALG